MKFFVDTADIDAIAELNELGMVDGNVLGSVEGIPLGATDGMELGELEASSRTSIRPWLDATMESLAVDVNTSSAATTAARSEAQGLPVTVKVMLT